MDRSTYKQHLQTKINAWGKELSILEDDIERSEEDNKADYQLLMQDLMRDFEDLESRLDEIDDMIDDVFEEEKDVMDEMIEEFEVQLHDARSRVKDV